MTEHFTSHCNVIDSVSFLKKSAVKCQQKGVCEYIYTHTLSSVISTCQDSQCYTIDKTFEDSGKAEQSEYGKKTREWSKKKQFWIKA